MVVSVALVHESALPLVPRRRRLVRRRSCRGTAAGVWSRLPRPHSSALAPLLSPSRCLVGEHVVDVVCDRARARCRARRVARAYRV